jgi:hypothetical protein
VIGNLQQKLHGEGCDWRALRHLFEKAVGDLRTETSNGVCFLASSLALSVGGVGYILRLVAITALFTCLYSSNNLCDK